MIIVIIMIILCMIIVFKYRPTLGHCNNYYATHRGLYTSTLKIILVKQKSAKNLHFVLCYQSIGALVDIMGSLVPRPNFRVSNERTDRRAKNKAWYLLQG